MDGDLYDEFGNYIGPELESDESEGEEEKYGKEEEEVRREGVAQPCWFSFILCVNHSSVHVNLYVDHQNYC